MKCTATGSGIYSKPLICEVANEIRGCKERISVIGCVEFKIVILESASFINTDHYDELHKTGTNGTSTSQEVVDILMKQKAANDEKFNARYNQWKESEKSKPVSAYPKTGLSASLFAPIKPVESDKRFKKSDKPGYLYEASSLSTIPDTTLIAYGFKPEQWERHKIGMDKFVLIKSLPVNEITDELSSSSATEEPSSSEPGPSMGLMF